MKVLAVLLCVFVAVQGRSSGAESSQVLAAAGENPWLVHLRLAVSTSGLLNTCAGSVIDNRWVLTSASCIRDARFIWIRFGAVNVIHPELVLEVGLASLRLHPTADIGLLSLTRIVESSANIAPIGLGVAEVPESGKFCAFGQNEDVPGEELSCYSVDLQSEEGVIVASSDNGGASKFDLGAPLVSEGVQVGVLTAAADDSSAGTFLPVSDYLDWIQTETGLDLSSAAAKAS